MQPVKSSSKGKIAHLGANVYELDVVLQELEDRVQVGQVLDAHLAALQLSHLVSCHGRRKRPGQHLETTEWVQEQRCAGYGRANGAPVNSVRSRERLTREDFKQVCQDCPVREVGDHVFNRNAAGLWRKGGRA